MFSYRHPSHVPPNGGWKFVHEESGVVISASSVENLIQKTKEFCRVNSFPIPLDLPQVIAKQVCLRCPDFCVSSEPPTVAEKMASLGASIKRWIAQKAPVAPAEVIMQRQAICESCELFAGSRAPYMVSCGKCGCTGLKVYLATERCPLPEPRWKAVS